MLVDMKQDAKFNPRTPPGPHAPPGSRIYAIGDVHGRLDLLDALLDQIALDASDPATPKRRVLVLLGDLIDRGPDSRGVLNRAAQLIGGQILRDFEVYVLKGNHEDSLLRFLAGASDGAQWRANGGNEMMQSYGLDPRQSAGSLRVALLDALTQAQRRTLRDLPLSHIEGDYAFVHAGVKPGIPFNEQSPDDLLWIRQAFTGSDADFGYCVVHGHSPVTAPDVRTNRIAIDTRAWSSGVLTALVLEGAERRFLST